MATPPEPHSPVDDLPPELPAQGIGPHFEINAEGKIDLAPPEALDRDGNYLPTLRSLHPELREMAAALARRLPKGNNTHALLGDRIAAYAALIDQDLAGVDFRRLYMAGLRLANGLRATDAAIAGGEAPTLAAEAREEIDSVLEGHGPFIMASQAGREAVAAAVAYRRQPDAEREYRAAAMEFADTLAANPEVITTAAAETVKDAAADIGEGVQQERGTVTGEAVIGNVTITLVTGTVLASLPVIGSAIAGPVSMPVIVGGLLAWAGFKILEKTDAGQETLEAGKRRFNDWAMHAPDGIRKLRERLAALPGFLKSVTPQLRHFSSIGPEYGWIARNIDWIEARETEPVTAENDPPDYVRFDEANAVSDAPPEFSQAAAEAMILGGRRPPEAWRGLITQLGFGRFGFDENGEFEYRVNGFGTRIDLTLLSGLSRLRFLTLAEMQVSELEPLRSNASLRSLVLNGTRVSELAPLRGLASLKRLDLTDTQVSNLKPLRGLASLEWLGLNGTLVSQLEPLRGLVLLQELWLDGTQVSDLKPLRGLTSLQTLWLRGTQVRDITPIANLKSLQTVALGGTGVDHLDTLAGLGQLRWLGLIGTPISEVAPLRNLTELQELHLGFTKVHDLSPLTGLIKLRRLDIRNTQVRDMTPLAHLPELRQLHLEGTDVTLPATAAFFQERRRLGLPGVEISAAAPD